MCVHTHSCHLESSLRSPSLSHFGSQQGFTILLHSFLRSRALSTRQSHICPQVDSHEFRFSGNYYMDT